MMRSPVADPFAPKPKPCNVKRYRWLISYADMITLVMAMFVLMLSVSTFDKVRFDQNATEMRKAFNVENGPRTGGPGTNLKIDEPAVLEDVETVVRQREWRTRTRELIRNALARELSSGMTSMVETEENILIRFPDTAAFSSGSADLRESILPALDRMTEVLRGVEGQLVVSGHTDNVPISTARFRSNWDLSVARAVSVVHYLVRDNRIEPARLTAQGFAESRPLAPNIGAENQAQNRRVEIAITIPASLTAEKGCGPGSRLIE